MRFNYQSRYKDIYQKVQNKVLWLYQTQLKISFLSQVAPECWIPAFAGMTY